MLRPTLLQLSSRETQRGSTAEALGQDLIERHGGFRAQVSVRPGAALLEIHRRRPHVSARRMAAAIEPVENEQRILDRFERGERRRKLKLPAFAARALPRRRLGADGVIDECHA